MRTRWRPPSGSGIIDAVARRQLLVYGFGTDAAFEGRLVGALERLGSGGTLRVTDVLFLHCDAETGERSAIGLRGTDAGRFVAPLLDFRLDRGARRRATARAFEDATIEQLAGTLQPGSAILALLVEHVWSEALEDAVSHTGGTQLASEFVDATALSPELLAPVLPA